MYTAESGAALARVRVDVVVTSAVVLTGVRGALVHVILAVLAAEAGHAQTGVAAYPVQAGTTVMTGLCTKRKSK